MAETEGGRENTVQGLMIRIGSLEQKIKMLREEIEEQTDLQTVNRLDIINLKNELERVKMSVPVLSPDIVDRIKGMEKLVSKQDKAGDFGKLAEDVGKLKDQMKSVNPKTLEEIQGEIASLYDMLKSQPSSGQKTAFARPKEIDEMLARLDALEGSQPERCPKCGSELKAGTKFCGKCGKKL
jgi:predicted  nucleic acid-binding Zn-ribbon protein